MLYIKEDHRGQIGGAMKRFLLIVMFILLLSIAFILAGGDKFLMSAGKQIEGAGKKAGEIKQQVEHKAAETGKAVEKVIDTVKQGEKK